MPESQSGSASAVPIALLHEAGDRDRHLKDALNELGAAIVYEAQARDLDRVALAGSGARIVVFNLDPDSEGEIDQVCEALDQGGYEVVFNDADASHRLSGTDQARWARHLAAKILRNPDFAEPPRPAWAESVPVPGQRAAPVAAPPAVADVAPEPVAVAAFAETPPAVEAPAAVSDAPDAPDSAAADSVAAAETPMPGFELPSEFVFELAPETAGVEAEAPASPSVSETPTLELPVLDEFNLEEIMLDAGAPAEPVTPPEDTQIELSGEFASALEDFAAHVPVHQYSSPKTADEFASELDSLFADARGGRAPKAEPQQAVEHAEFPAAFDLQLDAAAATVPEAVDGSFKPAPLPGKRDEAPDAIAGEPLLPPEWSLEPIDEGNEVKPLAGKSAAFGIETMSASDFLAPEDDGSAEPVPIITSDGLSLELMPMEDAVAPEAYAAAVPAAPPMAHEASGGKLKVGSGATLQRVVVLGASIGGPEAVREFLGALPRNFPALFVLAQHMGDEFLELMSAQLAKAVSMTVRTPTHGERVGHGEIVIVPTRQRLQIDNEGVITLSPLIERTAYSPSIDQVMRDIADEFGARANAIVFSGMAQDAIDGSKYLQSRGGSVWAQDPDTCTISTMVDSVRQTGAVAFVGSPDQLAAKMMAEHGSAS